MTIETFLNRLHKVKSKGKIEAGDGWVSYMEEGSPELMLKNLRSLLDEDKK